MTSKGHAVLGKFLYFLMGPHHRPVFALGGGQRSGQTQGREQGENRIERETCGDDRTDAVAHALLFDCLVGKLRKDTAEKEEVQGCVPHVVQGNKDF